MTVVEIASVAGRLLQFAAAAVLGGGSLFFLYGISPDRRVRWPVLLMRFAGGLGAVGTLGWLMAQAGQMGETPRAAFDPATVWSVAMETGFGRVALMRLGVFLLAFAATFSRWRGRGYWLFMAALGVAASASFAWTGHGVRDDGPAGALHLAADVLHLLAASVWIGALAALAVLAILASRETSPGAGRDSLTGLVRFSGIGVAVVAVLVASGLVNSWYLVGPSGLGRMLTSLYGQLLLAKLALFGLMLALAAANRYRHTPRLERALEASNQTGAPLRSAMISVLTETALAIVVLALVSWLGTISPPIEG
jgi:putative copper resistance protein D